MPGRILAIVLAAIIAGALAILTWPQAFGLQHAPVVAQLIAFRGPLVVVGAIITVIAAATLVFSRRKFVAAAFLLVFAVFTAANGAIIVSRGIGVRAVAEAAPQDSVTVLSWNTLGGAADARTIAELALAQHALIVSLPETTDEIATRVAEIMGENGSPMWSHTIAWSDSLRARSTSLLVSVDLGDYRVSDEHGTTSVLPSIVAVPVDGSGPAIAAVHPVAPIMGEMSSWRADLSWIDELCSSGELIAAGDFNATLDHLDLGDCADAALTTGTAAVGTWPTRVPALLSAPIDHVLSTPGWRAVSADVIQTEDGAGSDHRPIVATLVRTGPSDTEVPCACVGGGP